ncbi:hypothetical protein DH2020_020325 [Rehmannia glutinosa]|uniref:Phosphatidylinositol-glycan biosynthesis class X protein n=1 Tax=Rehmannia glutinosa TaxID=99300 RepID=A0ABR0WHW6_REHGL
MMDHYECQQMYWMQLVKAEFTTDVDKRLSYSSPDDDHDHFHINFTFFCKSEFIDWVLPPDSMEPVFVGELNSPLFKYVFSKSLRQFDESREAIAQNDIWTVVIDNHTLEVRIKKCSAPNESNRRDYLPHTSSCVKQDLRLGQHDQEDVFGYLSHIETAQHRVLLREHDASDGQMCKWKLNYFKQTNPMIRVVVIFLISLRSSVCASSYEQTCFMDKYMAKKYFEKYDSLIDQEFDNFIANEIPLSLSEVIIDKNHVVPTLSDLHRNVAGEGSHRRLSSSIRFKLQRKLKPKLTAYSCEVIIIERLPSGVFADPFELQHLVQRGVFTDAAVFGDTNLELPSFRSNQSVVEIHMSLASKVFSRYDDDLEVNLDVPLHARYPPLGVGFSRVEFGQPDLFMCCSLEGNVLNRSCLFMPVNHISDKKASPVIWEIPCGIKKHAGIVSAVTFGFAIVAAMLIVLTSICYSDSEGSNKFKLS